MSMRFIVPILFLFLVGQLNSWADGGPLDEIYRRQGSWQDTVAATREAFQLSGITVFPIGSRSYSRKAYPSKSLSEKFPPETITDESLSRTGYNNDIAMLSRNDLDRQLQTVFRPTSDVFVGDLDLHFNGRRLLISMPGANGRWQVHEIELDSAMLDAGIRPVARELSLIPDSDVDNYDACYLPNDNILFTSTATYAGVPCVRGKLDQSGLNGAQQSPARMTVITFPLPPARFTNPWGLLDMHGNVAEWTNSPYGSELGAATDLRVVRGGSWSDRPKWATASVRWGYREHQKVYNVGFRVIVRDPR